MQPFFRDNLTFEELEQLFQSSEHCLKFIAGLKWKDGFVCRKCGNTNYCQGKTPYSHRCTKCKQEESVTAGTIFHNCKFPINKAFYIAFQVCKGKDDISTYEFARRLTIRQMTCWNFKSKIQTSLNELNGLAEEESKEAIRLFTKSKSVV
jgi:hypothetical protein